MVNFMTQWRLSLWEDEPMIYFPKSGEPYCRIKKEGKKIWIVGGSQIIDMVRKKNLIDEYILNIAPVILGDGIPLFCRNERENLVYDESGKRYFIRTLLQLERDLEMDILSVL